MFKGLHEKKILYIINKHQLKDDVYYETKSKPKVYLPVSKFTLFKEFGEDSLYACPASEFDNLIGYKPISISKIVSKDLHTYALYGKDPVTMKNFIIPTDGQLNEQNYLVHSATTADHVCGSVMIDHSTMSAVGLHCRTVGPSRKQGGNNFVVPFF
jgi:hypothetical protein